MKHLKSRNMKRVLSAAMVVALLSGCGAAGTEETENPEETPEAVESPDSIEIATVDALEIITDMATTQYFTDEAVDETDLETILTAGANTPSAMNGQPWHFSVVTDQEVLQQIDENMSAAMSGAAPAGGMAEGAEPSDGTAADSDGTNEASESADTDPEPDETTATDNSGEEAGADTEDPDADAYVEEPGTNEGEALTKAGIADAPLAIIISCADGSELDAGLACQTMSAAAQLLEYGTKIISSPTMVLNGENSSEYVDLLGIPDGYSVVAVLLIGHEDTTVDESYDNYTAATERNPLDTMVTYISGSEETAE